MKAVKNAPTAVSSAPPHPLPARTMLTLQHRSDSNRFTIPMLKHSRKKNSKIHHQRPYTKSRKTTPTLKISCHDPIIYFDGSKMTGWFCCLKILCGPFSTGAGRTEPSSENFRHFHLASQDVVVDSQGANGG